MKCVSNCVFILSWNGSTFTTVACVFATTLFASVNAPLPAEDTKDKVEHEEGADDDEGNEVDPVEVAAHRVIRLEIMGRIEKCKTT